MKKLLYDVLSTPHCSYSMKKLKQLENRLQTPQSRFAIPFIFRGKGHFKSISCMQNPYEIEDLFNIVRRAQPRRVLEIGTARGGALYLWTQAASPDSLIISVDLPDGEFGGGYPACRIPFYQSFARQSQELRLVRADSHAVETLRIVKDAFAGQQIDFLFVDGDHTYEGVKQDFELYGPLVRPGGIIAFHDILPRPDIPEIQVDRFWKEIRDRFPTEELLGPDNSGRKIGSGVLHVPDQGLG